MGVLQVLQQQIRSAQEAMRHLRTWLLGFGCFGQINEGMNEGRREYDFKYTYEYDDDDDDDDDDDHNHFLCSSRCQHRPGGVEAV